MIDDITQSKGLSLILCLVSGIMGSIPYYCEELFIFTFLSLFSLFYIVLKQRTFQRRVFLPFFCYFFGFYAPTYLFLAELYPYERFGFDQNQAIFIVICSCIFIPLLHTLVEASLMSVFKVFKIPLWDIWGFACLWVVGEWILSLGTLAFPWTNVAVSLTGFLPYIQTASLFGKYFISFITVLGCCLFAYSIFDRKKAYAIWGVSVIFANLLIGMIIWFIPTNQENTIKTAVIQGNALADEKWTSDSRTKIFERYLEYSEEAAKNGAKIIVLPESAIAIYFVPDGVLHNSFAEITRKYDTTIIAGVHYYENGDSYNSVIGIMPDGSLSERYDKRHLVPFGEFIPFVDVIGKFLPFVAEFNAETGTYVEGNEPVVIDTEYGKVSPLVCFDSIFPEFAKDGVENDAQILAIVTNDSWFNDSFGIYTHLRHAQLRAIESKRYVLRAANTGISCFIDEKGRVINPTKPLTDDMRYCDAVIISEKTLYSHGVDFILYLSFALLIYMIILTLLNINNKGDLHNGNNATSSDRNL